MTETLKEHNYQKENEEKLVDLLYKATLREYPGIPIPDEELAKELLRVGVKARCGAEELTTLKEHLEPYSDKDIVKIHEEKIQLVTAAEFAEVHMEKLCLEKKLAIAVDALTHIKFNGLFKKAGPHGDYAPYDVDTQTELAEKALAEIGGEDEI